MTVLAIGVWNVTTNEHRLIYSTNEYFVHEMTKGSPANHLQSHFAHLIANSFIEAQLNEIQMCVLLAFVRSEICVFICVFLQTEIWKKKMLDSRE